jgi:hypothetical protein
MKHVSTNCSVKEQNIDYYIPGDNQIISILPWFISLSGFNGICKVCQNYIIFLVRIDTESMLKLVDFCLLMFIPATANVEIFLSDVFIKIQHEIIVNSGNFC